jgi:hypothetical protein
VVDRKSCWRAAMWSHNGQPGTGTLMDGGAMDPVLRGGQDRKIMDYSRHWNHSQATETGEGGMAVSCRLDYAQIKCGHRYERRASTKRQGSYLIFHRGDSKCQMQSSQDSHC